jgi:hypothetical protein
VRVHAATVGGVDSVPAGAARPTPGSAGAELVRKLGAPAGTGVYLTTAPSLAILLQMPWTSRFGSRKAVLAFTMTDR